MGQPNVQEKRVKKKTPKDGICTTIYIGNLHYKISEKDLTGIFGKFGKVGKIKLVKDLKTQKSKGIAFVELYGEQEVENAIKRLNGSEVDGRTVKVSLAIDNGSEEKKKQQILEKAKKKERAQDNLEKIIAHKRNKRKKGLNELFTNLAANKK